MNSDLIRPDDFQIFTFNDCSEVRVIVENGQPLFMANDVCTALGYGNPREALSKHCKESSVTKRDIATKYGNKPANFLDESNLYRLIMRSKMDKAVEFQDWVCEEVLPSIRKTGKYSKQESKQEPIQLTQGKLFRANDLRYELYLQGHYDYRKKGRASFLSPRLIINSLCAIGFIYKDTKSKKWVATNYALENSFAVNVPVKQFITFNHDGSVKKTATQYTFALTEAGVKEYSSELTRFSKKLKIQPNTQQKLLSGGKA